MATILVTAGPTREYLDGVRYLANGSSGRMGFAIAAAARDARHKVRLVLGPTDLEPPDGVEVIHVVSAVDMHEAAVAAFEDADVAFGVAAVADFRPAQRAAGKPSKEEAARSIELVPNPDVIAALGAQKGRRCVVGFALQGECDTDPAAARQRARAKLERKGLDLIVLNAPRAMGAEDSVATLMWADGRVDELAVMPKARLGKLLVERALEHAAAPSRRGGMR